jgi:hypothetical protein
MANTTSPPRHKVGGSPAAGDGTRRHHDLSPWLLMLAVARGGDRGRRQVVTHAGHAWQHMLAVLGVAACHGKSVLPLLPFFYPLATLQRAGEPPVTGGTRLAPSIPLLLLYAAAAHGMRTAAMGRCPPSQGARVCVCVCRAAVRGNGKSTHAQKVLVWRHGSRRCAASMAAPTRVCVCVCVCDCMTLRLFLSFVPQRIQMLDVLRFLRFFSRSATGWCVRAVFRDGLSRGARRTHLYILLLPPLRGEEREENHHTHHNLVLGARARSLSSEGGR